MDLSSLADAFYEEAQEYFDDIESNLLSIDLDDPDNEVLNAIFRCAHSVKGGAGTFGFSVLQDSTHLFENALDDLRNGEITMTQELVDGFLEINDLLKDQLSSYQAGETPDEDGVGIVKHIVTSVCDNTSPAQAEPEALSTSTTEDASSEVLPEGGFVMDVGHLDEEQIGEILEEMAILGDVSRSGQMVLIDTDDSLENVMLMLGFILSDDACEKLNIREPETGGAQGDSADESASFASNGETDTPAIDTMPKQEVKTALLSSPKTPTKKPAKPVKKAETSLRVPVDKIDHIINLVGELVITQSMLEQAAQDQEHQISNELSLLERNARDLQEAVMSVRMVPMETVFSRFPRQVRDIAKKLDKQIDLVTEGESTELDKGMVEKIVDPLSHLVRNSLDHGIERPEDREAKGKSPNGTLTLSAKHQGGNIIIEVIDDGAGLDRERLLSKAQSNGLPVSDNMSDEDVWQLIFAPGFSTADEITDVSGRGVGMDVVKKNIQSLGGSIQITSKKDQGTRTQISLPLTLAILDGMSIRCHGETYILPLGTVLETLQPVKEDIYTMSGSDQVLKIRDDYLPIVYLAKALQETDDIRDATETIAIIVQAEGKQYALIVDELVGQQQVVVKNLETNYRKVDGFSAATILGDGRVALILDVNEILKLK